MKCAKICGDTSGNYHPHGEAVIYPTLVHMAQHWAMRDTLVDPRQLRLGGRRSPGGHALYRGPVHVTWREPFSMIIEKDTVDFVPNYDES